MNTQANDPFSQLSQLFPAGKIKFRAGATNQEKTRAQALAYIDARDVMERLDQVVTPAGWTDSYQVIRQTPAGVEIECSLTVNGITKRDVGTGEDCKSAYSDAFKRAAVKFGVGRYLYNFPCVWVDYDPKRKTLVTTPSLPAWAIPATTKATPAVVTPPAPAAAAPAVAPAPELAPAVATTTQAEQNIQSLFAGANNKQNRRFHALGQAVYGKEWDAKRAEIINWYTNGRTSSSKELTSAEMATLITKLSKKADELQVPALQREDANDILF